MAKKAVKKAAGTAKSVVDTSKYRYEATKFRDKDGKLKVSRGNDDALARALTNYSQSGKSLEAVAKANKVEDRLSKEYVNAGQYRMALGNVLRGLIRNNTPVNVGGVIIKSLTQRVAIETGGAPKKATKKQAAEAA